MAPPTIPIETRFWAKVEKDGPIPEYAPHLGPCWIWAPALNKGYGVLGRPGKYGGACQAHRFAYQLLIGPIPEGLHLDHLCRVPACVNPDHLEPVTSAENMRRMPRKIYCKQGHPFTDENTYWHAGKRHCRDCRAVSKAAWNDRDKGRVAA